MEDQHVLRHQLEKLNQEHREIDEIIARMLEETIVNQIAIQRLKKRKLLLKDQMLQIQSKLLPDIIA